MNQQIIQQNIVYVQFKEPMILLLLASALVSVIMHQYDDALSIFFVSFVFYFIYSLCVQ